MHVLASASDYRELLARSQDEPVLIYKHSNICGLSTWARQRLEEAARNDGLPVYRLIVQKARALSNQIEAEWGIRHESPQVIMLHRGEVLHHASHRRISVEAIRESVQRIPQPE